MKKIKIIDRKLGRERALGQAYKSEKLIEIDPRLRSRRRITVLVHEVMHVVFPRMSESRVDRASATIGKMVWEDGYRRIER